jgi:hypothetical protein
MEAMVESEVRRSRSPELSKEAAGVEQGAAWRHAFEERGSAILHLLSPRRQIASHVCLLCWRRCLASAVVDGEA